MVEYQIIVLYANLDDKPDNEGQRGWVGTLVENLERLLKRLTGQEFTIMKLSEYDLDPDTFPLKTSVIVPIFSKNFLQAPIFMSYLSVLEREVVKKKNRKKDSARINFLSVFKNQIPLDDIPEYVLKDKFFNFYEVDLLTDFVKEITYLNDSGKDHNYWMKVFDMAMHIRNYDDHLKSPVKAAEKLVKELKPSGIYIAQAGLDQENQRDNLYRELLRSQYEIYQLESLDGSYQEIEKQIYEKLSKCQISVHLVGEDSGKIIKDKGLPILEIENKLASEHSRQINDKPGVKYYSRFNRIIWLSNIQENLTVKQKIFIDNLKKDLINIQYAEILECPIETLKGFIVDKIKQSQLNRESTMLSDSDKTKSIYLICNISEREQCMPISKFLEGKGYQVKFSNFDGELLQIRNNHMKNLKECDGTLIYYGNNSENWVKSKLFDSVKALGLGRSKDKNPTAIIVDSNKKVDLDLHFDTNNLVLLKNKKVNKNSFKSFLNQLE
jgi:hypothetical protein